MLHCAALEESIFCFAVLTQVESEWFSPDFFLSSISIGSRNLLCTYKVLFEKKAASCITFYWDRVLAAGFGVFCLFSY